MFQIFIMQIILFLYKWLGTGETDCVPEASEQNEKDEFVRCFLFLHYKLNDKPRKLSFTHIHLIL